MPKPPAGIEVVEDSFVFPQLKKGAGQLHARTEGRQAWGGFDPSRRVEMLLCRAPVIFFEVEKPQELVDVVKGVSSKPRRFGGEQFKSLSGESIRLIRVAPIEGALGFPAELRYLRQRSVGRNKVIEDAHLGQLQVAPQGKESVLPCAD